MKYLLIGILVGSGQLGWAQCSGSFSIKGESLKPGQDEKESKIEVIVRAPSSYQVDLISFDTAERSTKASKKSRGNDTVTFANIEDNKMYLVRVKFDNESDPFCAELHSDPIFVRSKGRLKN